MLKEAKSAPARPPLRMARTKAELERLGETVASLREKLYLHDKADPRASGADWAVRRQILLAELGRLEGWLL